MSEHVSSGLERILWILARWFRLGRRLLVNTALQGISAKHRSSVACYGMWLISISLHLHHDGHGKMSYEVEREARETFITESDIDELH
jgi:hypothetical protein